MWKSYSSCSFRNALAIAELILVYFKYAYNTWNKTCIELQIKLHLEDHKADRAAICDIPAPGKAEGSRGILIYIA